MSSQRKAQQTAGPTPNHIPRINIPKSAGSSTQYDRSGASWRNYTPVSLSQATDPPHSSETSPNNGLSVHLTTESLALNQLEIDLMPSALYPNISFNCGRTGPTGERSPTRNSNSISSRPRSYYTEGLKKKDPSGDIEASPHGGSEWQDLLEFLEAEKARVEALHSMSPMERFIAED